jgi:RNA polymerase sigma factor (sigma-70 family)
MGGTTPTFCEASSAPNSIEAQLARHDRLLHFALKRYVKARPALAEDIVEVGRAALADVLETYSAEMGFAFSTYAHHQMQWRVSCFLRKFTRNDNVTTSLDEARGEDEDGAFTLADVADHQVAAREQAAGIADENLLRRIHDLRVAIATCTTLTSGEREILKEYLECGNCGTVAARLGITSARVSQLVASAAAKLRKHLRVRVVTHE